MPRSFAHAIARALKEQSGRQAVERNRAVNRAIRAAKPATRTCAAPAAVPARANGSSFSGNSGEPCRTDLHKGNQTLAVVNRENPGVENAQEIAGLANLLKPDKPKESPARLAGRHGAITDLEYQTCDDDTPKRRRSAISKFAKRAHKKAAKLLGYALVLGTYEAWETASAIWQARLTETERAALAWAALRSLDHDDAVTVAETALGRAGAPDAPLFSEMDQAAFWAERAAPDELAAYAVAIFRAMSRADRRDFLSYAGRAAA